MADVTRRSVGSPDTTSLCRAEADGWREGGRIIQRPRGRVVNRAIGAFRNVLQVGTVVGDVHLHESRRIPAAVMIAVWLPALVAVFALVPADSARQARAPAATDRPSSSAPTVSTTTVPARTTVPPVQPPPESRTVVVRVSDGPVVAMDGLRIAVNTAGYTHTYDGSVHCGGGSNGPGGGSCGTVGGDGAGSSDLGVINFSVITPTLTCRVTSVHIDESAVVTEPGGRWTRIVLLAVGPHAPDSTLPVTFDVSRGLGPPIPLSPKVCVPS